MTQTAGSFLAYAKARSELLPLVLEQKQQFKTCHIDAVSSVARIICHFREHCLLYSMGICHCIRFNVAAGFGIALRFHSHHDLVLHHDSMFYHVVSPSEIGYPIVSGGLNNNEFLHDDTRIKALLK